MNHLSIFIHKRDAAVYADGIMRDETIFENASFTSVEEFCNYVQRVLRPQYTISVYVCGR
jgi:hypothetical protein